MTSRAGQRLRGGQIRWPDECRRTPAKLPMHAAQTCQSRRMTRLSVRKWRRDRRLKGRDYTPHLWPVWFSLPLALIAALLAGTLIYYFLEGSPLVEGATPLEKTRTAITLAAGIGATLAGLYAYRKQRLEEGSAKRADADQFSTRYNSAAEQLGSDAPAVRLAGVYALHGWLTTGRTSDKCASTSYAPTCAWNPAAMHPGTRPRSARRSCASSRLTCARRRNWRGPDTTSTCMERPSPAR